MPGLKHQRFILGAVFAIICVILAAIYFVLSPVVKAPDRSSSKVQSEMRIITVALAAFKQEYGEYPPMDNANGSGSPFAEQNLMAAITGHARWTIDPATGSQIWEMAPMSRKLNDGKTLPNGEKYAWGHAYVELTRFKYDIDNSTASTVKEDAVIHDPYWDGQPGHNAYLYRYKTMKDCASATPSSWQNETYLLISRGPDGLPANADDNFLWKAVNGHTQFSGFLVDDYFDSAKHPGCTDNYVDGATHLP